VGSVDADAQAAARRQAPKVSVPAGPVVPQLTDPVSVAVAEAARTGRDVVVGAQTTQTSITWAKPDGTVRVESSAGPVRVRQGDGSWAPVDTTLERTAVGVRPRMVPGETTFSAGGTDLLASLSDRNGTSITMRWGGLLPEPVIKADTATYRDVFAGVDLVLTATRLGFTQLLVVNRAPTPLTLAALATINIPVATTGAAVTRGKGGGLQVVDERNGRVVGTAAAPLMWDARRDPRTDQPVAVREVGLAVAAAVPNARSGGGPGQGNTTLSLTPDLGVFADPATVYPVTIDPTQTLGALGDTFVQNNIEYSPQGGSTELRTGTYNGGAQVDRSLLRFDVTALKNRNVQSANLALFEFHSYSCSPRWVDIREAGDFDPNTVTWPNQPWIGGILANANVAYGYSGSCPANWVNFNLTGWAQNFADARNNRPNVMPLAVQVGDERDSFAWKKFNSGNAGGNVPTLTFTFDGGCDQYNGNNVCGAIRDKWWSVGGPNGYLGLPVTSDALTGNGRGYYNHFQGGSIFWSPSTGAHTVNGAIRDKWASIGYDGSRLGFPTTDDGVTASGDGRIQHFEAGTILYSAATGAFYVVGAIRDKYAALGWDTAYLGYPLTDEFGVPGGAANHFQRGSIYWSPSTGAHNVQGSIRSTWAGLGWEGSFLGFPTSDEYPIASGARSDFQGGQITWDSATNTTLWSAGPSAFAGTPGWGTPLTYQLSDTTTATVNVGTGNLTLSIAGLTVPGVGGDRGIGVVYNSLHTATGSVDTTGLLGAGFRLTESPDVRLVAYPDGSVRYIDATGRAAVFAFNRAGNRYDSPVGDGGKRMTRDGAGNWVLTTLASNRTQTFRAADGLVVSDSNRNGVAYTFSYDTAGKPTSITGTRGGAAVTFTFGGTGVPAGQLGQMSQTVDGATRTVSFGYTSAGQLASVRDSSGGTTAFGWTGDDITTVTTPGGTSTAVSYDTGHRVTQVVRDVGSGRFNATTAIAYTTTAAGFAEQRVTDANNNRTTYRVDALGKVITATDALGHVQAATYSPNNDVLTAVDAMPLANTTTYSYSDAAGGFTPTGVRIPTGASAGASYPATGSGPLRYRPSTASDPQGNVTTVGYDQVGNPTQQSSGGVSTTATYNPPAGQPTVCAGGGKPGQVCTSTDGRANTTTFTYDSVGNVRTVTPPAGVIKAVSYTYDGVGRPATVTDGRGQVTSYVYDTSDRVTEIRYNNASSCTTTADCQVYTYDAVGNLITRVDAAGITRYVYDALNRLVAQISPPDSGGGAQSSSLSYDLGGNTVSFADDGGTIRYGYDAGNNLTSVAEPGGSCTATISGCTTFTYDATDTRTQTTYPGGSVVTRGNTDAAGRSLSYLGRAGDGTVVMDLAYSYTTGSGADSALLQSRTNRLAPGGAATQAYSYDGLNRLGRALEKVGATPVASWSYCYDPNGNRTFDTTSTAATIACPGQSGGPAPTYTYDATNALTARAGQPAGAFTYDGNGAEIRGAGAGTRTNGTWTPRSQLKTLTVDGSAHTYTYAGEGNKERTAFDTSGYQNTALGITTQTGTTANRVIREPNGTPVALRTNNTSYYYITDQQGSTISLVDQAGVPRNSYSYDPYGNSRTKTETATNPYQYIGGQLDTTGLYHLQNRYYDPTLGRFTQPDPSGQETNPYAYTGGNPVNNTDPSGLIGRCEVAGAAGGVLGAIVGGAAGFGLGPVGVGIGGAAGAGLGAGLTAGPAEVNPTPPRGEQVMLCSEGLSVASQEQSAASSTRSRRRQLAALQVRSTSVVR
jgi:RHS repeat-associated protein